MSRLPIAPTALMLLACAAMMLPLLAYAQGLPQTQHGIVSSLSQLEDNKGVRQYREAYPALSAANLIYAKCDKEYDIADSEKDYLKLKFDSVTKGYISAYQDAYVQATSSSPPQSFLNDVAAALTKRQQDAVDNVAVIIRQKGCNDGRLRSFVNYVANLHKQDKKIANTKPVAPAQPYQ